MPEQKATPADIEIRLCSAFSEYEECERLQAIVWGEDLVISASIFVVAHHTGGQVIGAFDGKNLVAFTMALAGVRGGEPFLHSHMTAVLAEYRDRGVGRRLKLFQRRDALKRGIVLVEWTFDPLELKNAYFNLVRLGAIARRFIPNCYGVTESPLHAGLPTDRLVAEWWIDSDRVKNILADNSLPAAADTQSVSLPADLIKIKAKDRAEAARVQAHARTEFQRMFHQGYIATGLEPRGATTDYILEPSASVAGLRLPEYRPEEFED